MKIKIQQGDDWVRVYEGETVIMENHGDSKDWKELFVSEMLGLGNTVEELDGYFEDDDTDKFKEY